MEGGKETEGWRGVRGLRRREVKIRGLRGSEVNCRHGIIESAYLATLLLE